MGPARPGPRFPSPRHGAAAWAPLSRRRRWWLRCGGLRELRSPLGSAGCGRGRGRENQRDANGQRETEAGAQHGGQGGCPEGRREPRRAVPVGPPGPEVVGEGGCRVCFLATCGLYLSEWLSVGRETMEVCFVKEDVTKNNRKTFLQVLSAKENSAVAARSVPLLFCKA